MYANVVTSDDPTYFRIYIGSASGLSTGHKDSGISRRVKEHMRSAKNTSHRQSGMRHFQELNKPGIQKNFIVLVCFKTPVDGPIVRIAEAVMTIIFNAWDDPAFLALRPRHLVTIPEHYGLNSASPLASGVESYADLARSDDVLKRDEYLRRCRANGKRVSSQNKERRIRNAREGGPVAVTCSGHQFLFTLLKQRIYVPHDLVMIMGLDIARTVNVTCDICTGIRHHAPYACKAKLVDIGSRLGIKLRGRYTSGANKGSPCEKWIQSNSMQAVSKANTIADLIQKAT